jgi:hypothetical protein
VRASLALRLLGLAAVALLAVVVVVALKREDSESSASSLPAAAPAPGGGWYKARAASLPAPASSRPTDCSVALSANTVGVMHPVLPCRAQVYVEFGKVRVLTRVIGRGSPARSEFGLTKALADELGVHGLAQIKWRFAAAPSP